MSRCWRLGTTTRKGVLLVHIASAGAWLGVDVVMAVLVFRALLTDEQARQFDAGLPVPLEVGQLIFPPMVSPTALLVAMLLAVFKPWGRIRRSGRPGTR